MDGVLAPIQVIAQKDQRMAAGGRKSIQQSPEQRDLAMQIPNGVRSRARIDVRLLYLTRVAPEVRYKEFLTLVPRSVAKYRLYQHSTPAVPDALLGEIFHERFHDITRYDSLRLITRIRSGHFIETERILFLHTCLPSNS